MWKMIDEQLLMPCPQRFKYQINTKNVMCLHQDLSSVCLVLIINCNSLISSCRAIRPLLLSLKSTWASLYFVITSTNFLARIACWGKWKCRYPFNHIIFTIMIFKLYLNRKVSLRGSLNCWDILILTVTNIHTWKLHWSCFFYWL